MTPQEFVDGLRAGNRRVKLEELTQEVHGVSGPSELGEVDGETHDDVLRQMNNPRNANRDDPMIVVTVDKEFRGEGDDGLRECSVSQVVEFVD